MQLAISCPGQLLLSINVCAGILIFSSQKEGPALAAACVSACNDFHAIMAATCICSTHLQVLTFSPASSMDPCSHHHVFRAIECGGSRVQNAAPFQELSSEQPTVGLDSLKDQHRVIRKEERHHKTARNKQSAPKKCMDGWYAPEQSSPVNCR